MTPEEQLEQELASLSPEELDQYEQELMASSQPQEDSPFKPGQTHMIDPETNRAIPIPEEMVQPEISETDALMRGMQEAIPFAKDAEAATSALLDTGASFDESYSRNMDEINEAINDAEEKHPIAFNVGDFGASLSLPMAKGYKAAMSVGALSSLSRSEDRDAWDALTGAGFGAAGTKIGKLVGSGADIVGKKLGLISDDTTKEILVRGGSVEEVNAHIRKWFMGKEDDLTEGTAKFAKHVLGKKVGGRSLIEGNDVPESIHRKASDLTSKLGNKIDEVIEGVDYKLPSGEVSNIFSWIKRESGIDDLLESKSTVAQDKGAELLKKLRSEFFEETGDFIEVKSSQIVDGEVKTLINSVPKMKPKELTLKNLVGMKRVYADMSSIKHLNGQAIPASDNVEFWGKVTKTMSKLVPELAENTGKLDKASFRSLNKDFATALLVKNTTKALADKEKSGMLGKLRNLLQYKSMVLTSSMLAGATVGGAPGAIVASSAAVLTGLASDPRAPQKFSIGLRRLANNLQNPNYAKYIQKLSVTAGVSTDAFRNSLSSVASQLYLEASPMKRSVDSAIENSQEILNIMTDEMPEMTPVFRKALENNDKETIARVMEQLASLESAGSFIEGGRGFDGITFNPETKIKVAIEVEKMDISRRQKSELLKGLKLESDEAGVLPQVQPEPNRFLEMRTRDKRRPQY